MQQLRSQPSRCEGLRLKAMSTLCLVLTLLPIESSTMKNATFVSLWMSKLLPENALVPQPHHLPPSGLLGAFPHEHDLTSHV